MIARDLKNQTLSDELECIDGTFEDRCNGCLADDLTTSEYYYWMTEGGCGRIIPIGGMLDSFLDYLLYEARPQADAVISAR